MAIKTGDRVEITDSSDINSAWRGTKGIIMSIDGAYASMQVTHGGPQYAGFICNTPVRHLKKTSNNNIKWL